MRAIFLFTFALALVACDFSSSPSPSVSHPTEVDGGVVPQDVRSPDVPSATLCTGYASFGAALDPSSYRVVTIPSRFRSAEQSCEATRGHLVILDSDGEATSMAAAVTNGWVGYSDLKNEDTWIDVSGRRSPYMAAHWATNEPSTGGNDNCAFLSGAASLNAANCGSSDGEEGDMRGYVCECGDGIQGNPNNFRRPD